MAVDELDAVGDDAVGDGDGLLGIAGIVIKDDLEGLPVDAAIFNQARIFPSPEDLFYSSSVPTVIFTSARTISR